MGKLTFILVASVASYVLWYMRKAKARTRLREIDEGKRCVSCDGTDLQVFSGNASCRRCGHVVSLASFSAAVVSESELSNITRPDDNRSL